MFLRESWDVYRSPGTPMSNLFLTDGHGEICVFLSIV